MESPLALPNWTPQSPEVPSSSKIKIKHVYRDLSLINAEFGRQSNGSTRRKEKRRQLVCVYRDHLPLPCKGALMDRTTTSCNYCDTDEIHTCCFTSNGSLFASGPAETETNICIY
ncbi:hypothetical protein P5673_009052 [Acropora cervicornis]|uniref:Uncharacterized protein n=1 Tax=Acropora cervicornis TaxID=6130 RepID=A0AAD9QTI7_ACRCE|nr:hypothetical protein P5673_009052 [Acropora cervicornis]